MNPWLRFFGLRSVQVIGAAILVAAIGGGVGFYLATRPNVQPTSASHVGPAPSVAPAGTTAVATPQQSVVLSVIKTVPAAGSAGNAVDTRITLDFNLAVDPTTVNSFLGVVATGSTTAMVGGTLVAGGTPQEVVFKPNASFGTNTTVQVTLRGGVQSIDGSRLDTDYNFNFAIVPSPETVTFLSGYEQVRLVNAAAGQSVNLSIQAGSGLSSSVTLKTYRAGVQDLLNAFVYANGGYPDRAIDTSSMTPVENGGTSITASGARTSTVQDQAAVTVSQPDGLYVVVAADQGGQYGAVWINFSRYAILLRQDDQRVIVAGEDLTTGAASPQFAITFYNLLDGVHLKASGTFTGTAEYAAKYPSGFDIAVAQAGGEKVIVPMAAPETNGDIRILGDLSQQLQVFITTDRLAYHKGDTVRFAGAVRVSNDQVYTLGAGAKVDVWSPMAGKLALVTAAADGTFSGSFVMPAAVFNPDGSDVGFIVLAEAPASEANGYFTSASTTIVAAGTHSPAASLTVSFDKPSYTAGDTIVASIAGVDSRGAALAGKTLGVTLYASQHSVQPAELDNFAGSTSWGDSVQSSIVVKLDATGHAIYSFKANVAQKAADEEITLAATYGTGTAQAVGARTAIVYQAADEVFLLPGRTQYREGDAIVVPFVVEARDGTRAAGATMSYELDSTDYSGSTAITTVVASGSVAADANGLGVVRAPMATKISPVTLRLKGKDAAGHVFEDDLGLLVDFQSGGGSSGDVNPRLDVVSDKISYATGDSAQLTVTSPAAETALVSLERGRVHQYHLVQLAKGDNPLTVSVTSDLAPGFNVVISYFQGGQYTSQAFPVRVNNAARLLKVKLTPDLASYAKGQTAHVTIAVTDAGGAAVAANAMADGFDARMSAFKLVDKASIAGAFLTPDRLTTNASSSLLGIGFWGGRCGGGIFAPVPDPVYVGQTALWAPDVSVDASGHATLDVPLSTPVRLVVFVGTKDSGWGQAEIDLSVQ